jgi:hypothetical protein
MTASNDDRPSGICACGCGGRTALATITRNGNVRGEPCRYISGHRPRIAPAAPECDETTIETCPGCKKPMHRTSDPMKKRVCAAGHPIVGRGGECRRCVDSKAASGEQPPKKRARGGRRPGFDPLPARRAVSEWEHLGIVMGERVASVAKALGVSDEWLRRVVLANTHPDSDAHQEMLRCWAREHPNQQSRKSA